MSYKHGVSVKEVPTSIVPPTKIRAGLPVVFGTAPIHLAKSRDFVNKPTLISNFDEGKKNLGYSEDWEKYTLCEFMHCFFDLFKLAPVIFINVLDPDIHKADVASSPVAFNKGIAAIEDSVLLDTLVMKKETQTLVRNVDYTAAYNEKEQVIISVVKGGALDTSTTNVTASYTKLDPSKVQPADVIGGLNVTTNEAKGLEVLNKVFPMFRLVPGTVLAPGWSHDPNIANVMKSKASNINGLFKAIVLTDVDPSIKSYTDVPAWKNEIFGDSQNPFNSLQGICFPKTKINGKVYHLSTQAAAAICQTDLVNDDIPYVSPSNKNIKISGTVVGDGTEDIILGPEQAAYLNGEGIITALNFVGGWKLWGNRTAAYPANKDVKDSFLAVRRFFNWIGNTTILTYLEKVDNPLNRRLIDTVVDSMNIWLNGLSAKGALLAGKVEFRPDENSTQDLINGTVRFHVSITQPTPAENLEFILEFDTTNLENLIA